MIRESILCLRTNGCEKGVCTKGSNYNLRAYEPRGYYRVRKALRLEPQYIAPENSSYSKFANRKIRTFVYEAGCA